MLAPENELYTRELTAKDFSWVAGKPPEKSIHCAACPRYHAREASATVEPLPDSKARILFDEPQRAITTGQAVVLYDGDEVLGGGTIESA